IFGFLVASSSLSFNQPQASERNLLTIIDFLFPFFHNSILPS
ncbi:1646_t:CDS:1, partial [Funneliformis caledonium]